MLSPKWTRNWPNCSRSLANKSISEAFVARQWSGPREHRNFGSMVGHLAGPGVRIPGLFDEAEGEGQCFNVFALNIISTVVKNIDNSVIIQAQHCAGIESEPLLKRDANPGVHAEDDCFGLLDCHDNLL